MDGETNLYEQYCPTMMQSGQGGDKGWNGECCNCNANLLIDTTTEKRCEDCARYYCNECSVKPLVCTECELDCPFCNVLVNFQVDNKNYCETCVFEMSDSMLYCTLCDAFLWKTSEKKCHESLIEGEEELDTIISKKIQT